MADKIFAVNGGFYDAVNLDWVYSADNMKDMSDSISTVTVYGILTQAQVETLTGLVGGIT